MDSNTISILEQPLPLKQTKGNQKFNYVDGDDVRKKLNEAFKYEWSEELIDSTYNEHGAIVKLYVVVNIDNKSVKKLGIGQSDTSSNSALSIGDAFKTAHTNAIKDAAKGFGIGLGVKDSKKYTSVSFSDSKNETVTAPQPTKTSYSGTLQPFPPLPDLTESSSTVESKQVSAPKPVGTVKPVTDMQLVALKNISKKEKLSVDAVIKAVFPSMDVQDFSSLNVADASSVIKHWRNQEEKG